MLFLISIFKLNKEVLSQSNLLLIFFICSLFTIKNVFVNFGPSAIGGFLN